MKNKLKLTPGRFYKSKDDEVWCCYRVNLEKEIHCRADCIRTSDSRVEYFYLDGRYDGDGKREHCLIEEINIDDLNNGY